MDSEMNLVQSSTFFCFPLVKVIALCYYVKTKK